MADDTEDKRPAGYADAGVDTGAGARAVEEMREAVRSTYRPEVIGDIGGFGGSFAPRLEGMREPVLVSGADGVGTKLKLAQLLDRHDTVGIDLVAMCANDVVVSGAEPLFLLDYIAIGKLVPSKVAAIVEGVAQGCRQAGCALLGGETAEHPGVMPAEDYDLAGFCVGVAERERIVDGSRIVPGDVVLGLASSGAHSNGYSLIRRALVEGREGELGIERLDLDGRTLGEELLTPTRIYVRSVLGLLADGADVKGMAHITGGGISENLNRVLPEGTDALVARSAWRRPRIFELLAHATGLPEDELFRTFNMGVGFALVLSASDAAQAAAALRSAGERVYEIGEIVEGKGEVVYE
ncbi:MAG: phosphoribosylformylglycinamidine cyclo-ligase [Coriobacteriia bacterium]|nr:phosphoribosylformylglycinamidine cyclo-ligase [Coriobacteriia bacterium]